MPEDPFGDLSRSRSAGGPSAERDAAEEERPDEAPPPARPGSRYTWVVGVAALIAIAFVVINLLSVGVGESNLGPEPGQVLPDFAAPAASSETAGDANIRQASGGTDSEGAVPACEVEGDDVVNICELREQPAVVTFVLEGCEDALDRVERVRGEFPHVSFVGVISESPEVTTALADDGRWGFPVARDSDNAVSILYRAGDCPTTVFAEAGGEVAKTTLGYQSTAELRSSIAGIAEEPSRTGS